MDHHRISHFSHSYYSEEKPVPYPGTYVYYSSDSSPTLTPYRPTIRELEDDPYLHKCFYFDTRAFGDDQVKWVKQGTTELEDPSKESPPPLEIPEASTSQPMCPPTPVVLRKKPSDKMRLGPMPDTRFTPYPPTLKDSEDVSAEKASSSKTLRERFSVRFAKEATLKGKEPERIDQGDDMDEGNKMDVDN